MKKPESVHVVPNKENGTWDVKRSNADRVTRHCETQKEAIQIARPISQHQKAELFIHGENGRIRERDSHGHDPSNIKG